MQNITLYKKGSWGFSIEVVIFEIIQAGFSQIVDTGYCTDFGSLWARVI